MKPQQFDEPALDRQDPLLIFGNGVVGEDLRQNAGIGDEFVVFQGLSQPDRAEHGTDSVPIQRIVDRR